MIESKDPALVHLQPPANKLCASSGGSAALVEVGMWGGTLDCKVRMVICHLVPRKAQPMGPSLKPTPGRATCALAGQGAKSMDADMHAAWLRVIHTHSHLD